MHKINNHPRTSEGPQTTGKTLHWAGQYDFMTSLLGFGVNSRGSRMVIEMARIQPGDKVLDVGCGTGNLTLTARGYTRAPGSVYGIDASPEMIRTAQEKARRTGSDVTFEVGLIEKIPYPESTFDVVISRLMVHHLPDDLKRQAFAEVLRVLKPGGLFFIADFNRPDNPLLAHLSMAMVGHGMAQTNVWSLPAMLSESGFVEVNSGKTRSVWLAFVSGRKPAADQPN
jgi:demethylmenaquinone methyltransferase/2-methoxy-6-polyprenyl-1,4-benzoquinol methylase/phosphoethanolamine N-methyltransferase